MAAVVVVATATNTITRMSALQDTLTPNAFGHMTAAKAVRLSAWGTPMASWLVVCKLEQNYNHISLQRTVNQRILLPWQMMLHQLGPNVSRQPSVTNRSQKNRNYWQLIKILCCLNCWDLITHWHGVISQKNRILNYTTSNTSKYSLSRKISSNSSTHMAPTEDMIPVIKFNIQTSTIHFRFKFKSVYVHNLEPKMMLLV
jgi:hypothetical protein